MSAEPRALDSDRTDTFETEDSGAPADTAGAGGAVSPAGPAAPPRMATIADAQASPWNVPGPITSAYRADPRVVIERLNQLRSTEIVSYLQYKQHAYMAMSLLGPGVKAEFLEHAEQELTHADRLGERISQLGGVPLYDLHEIAQKAADQKVRAEQGETLEQMVLEDLEVERVQIERYTTLIREIGDGDPVTRRLLEDILKDSEAHAAELRDLLQHRAAESEGPSRRRR